MIYMNKLFYNLGSMEQRIEKVEERKNYDSTLQIGLKIKPEKQKINTTYTMFQLWKQ